MKRLTKGSFRIVREEWDGPTREVEFWGFRADPFKRDARKIAWDFLRKYARLFNLGGSLDTLERPPRVMRSLGARHVLFQQKCGVWRIHRAYVTVHMDNQGCVYLVKNHAVPKTMMPEPGEGRLSEREAMARALKEFSQAEKRLVPAVGKERLLRTEKLLFWKKGKLYPAYRCRLHLRNPRAEWIVYINARSGGVLDTYDNLAKASARGRVFDSSPAYRYVTLRGLTKRGVLDGRYVTTKPTRWRAKRKFFYESGQRRFAEVMAYYHIDAASRYLEVLGYNGPRRVLGRRLGKDAHGKRLGGPLAVDAFGTRLDNSWYSPGLGLLTFGCGGVNDAEDGEVVLHEFGHALQDAICPDFGLSREAAAMGEGFGDYLAASIFANKKAADYRTWVITWGIAPHSYNSPGLRRVDEDLTFDDFVDEKDCEHENGKIWSATLWGIREALGCEKADTLIIESHFQLDAFTTFNRGARAILDAAQNLYGGRYRRRLLRIFRDRRIRPVARRN